MSAEHWSTHIKLLGRYWLREPRKGDRNTIEELQFLAGTLLDAIDPIDWHTGSHWDEDGSCSVDNHCYQRPRLDLPEIPEGYTLFGEGPVPGEMRECCRMSLTNNRWSIPGTAKGDDVTNVYIVRTDLWQKYVADEQPVVSDWERWKILCGETSGKLEFFHDGIWYSGSPSVEINNSWRIIRKTTRDRTPDEWREWLSGEYDECRAANPILYHLKTPCPDCGSALTFDAGYPATREEPGDDGDGLVCSNRKCQWLPEEDQIHPLLEKQLAVHWEEQANALWHNGKPVHPEVEAIEVIAEYDPRKPEGERITEGGAE